MQKLGGKVGAISPLDGVASEAVLDELVTVKQLAENLAPLFFSVIYQVKPLFPVPGKLVVARNERKPHRDDQQEPGHALFVEFYL